MRQIRCPLPSLVLALLLASCARAQSGENRPFIAAEGLGADLHEYLQRTVPLGFAGAVLVAREGEIILHGGYGLADRENGVPVTAETIFDTGSITKQFTAAAILKLEEQGKLSTSDSIDRFFADVPADKQGITLHHLLTHSSGLVGDLEGYGDYDVMPRDRLVRLAIESEMQSAPGTRFAYSNLGYGLLGAIIEIVSGHEYERFIHEHLFQLAGLQKTGYTVPRWNERDVVVGYSVDGERVGTPLERGWAPDGPWWILRANGGMLFTVGDLYRWSVALDRGLVLSEASMEKMTAPHVAIGAGVRHYGYGWIISETAHGTRLISHDGGSYPAFFADFLRYVDDDVVVILASHVGESNPNVRMVRRAVIDAALSGTAPAIPPEPQLSLSLEAAGRYVGTYALPSGARFVVSLQDGLLVVDALGQEAVDILMGYSEEEAAEANRLSVLAGDVIGGFSTGDLEPLREASADFERRRGVMERIWRTMEGRSGAFRTYEILGTVPSWWEEVPTLITFARLDFERDGEPFRLHWNEAGVFGFSVGNSMFGRAPTTLIPQVEHGFVGYNLGIQRPVPVQFRVGRDRSVSDFVIRTSDGEVVARKLHTER